MNFAAVGNFRRGGDAAGRGDLRELLQARLLDPAAVRTEIRTVRHAGLDPGIPPEFFHRLGLAACIWGFSKTEVAEFAAAVAAGDEAVMAKMLRRKRRFAEIGLAALAAAVEGVLRPGGIPALGVR